MSVITLEVPDEIAAQISLTSEDLTRLIKVALAAKLKKLSSSAGFALPETPVYQELVDLLSSSPTVKQVVAFKLPTRRRNVLKNCFTATAKKN